MAITIVGTPQTGSAINGANLTLTFSTTPAENDIVLVFGGSSRFITPNPTAPGSGYTQIALNAANVFVGAWYKRMGASPDASVVCYGSGNTGDTTAYGCYILRGVDTSTALDAAATTAGETSSTNPNAPSITTVTNGAWVFALAGSKVNDATPGTISGYSNQIFANNTDTFSFTTAGATLEKTTAGAEDPAAWPSWATGLWYAITVALRPATSGGWTNIGKINRVTATTFGKINRVPVAEIGKVNRVPV